MASKFYEINHKEEKNRKHWLLATICLFVIYPIFLFSFLAIASESVLISEDALYAPLGYAVGSLIPLWMILPF